MLFISRKNARYKDTLDWKIVVHAFLPAVHCTNMCVMLESERVDLVNTSSYVICQRDD